MFWNHYDFIQGNGYYDIIQICTHKQKYMNHRLSENAEFICNFDVQTEIDRCTEKSAMSSLVCSPQFQAAFIGREENWLYSRIPGPYTFPWGSM